MSAKPEGSDSSITAIFYQRPASPLASVRTRPRSRIGSKSNQSRCGGHDDFVIELGGENSAVIVQGTKRSDME